MAYIFIVTSAVAAFLTWHIFCLLSNYVQARSIGLPILLSPVDPMNPFWLLLHRHLSPVVKLLPFGLGSWMEYSEFGWGFKAKDRFREKMGSAFTIVNPGKNIVMVSDAEAVENITSRRKDFQKSEEMYKPLELFGPNLDTVEGETWQRHRRITTPPFNERNSGLVWRESLRQAADMLDCWKQKSTCVTTADDTMMLALHVITAAGFGKSYPFASGSLQNPSPGYSLTYRDALRLILANMFTTIIAVKVSIPDWLSPKSLRDVRTAIKDFQRYMAEMVDEERDAIAKEKVQSDNLMSVLIRASEASTDTRNALSGLELSGNLFIYSFAGHETTANTLAYAVALLSANKECQDWLSEEIEAVFGSQQPVEKWQYEKAFPQLKRCLAVMYETLRLYGPVFFIPKYTNDSTQRVVLGSEEHTIPPKTYVYIDSMALHTTTEYWGADPLEWKPQRWISSQDGEESFFEPKAGSFVPWASGPRVCPGKKFSQVEFAAVIACLFRKHRVQPVLEPGETETAACQRILGVIEDSGLEVTLRMKHPERIKLHWTPQALD